jgi:hypothetical protein
METMTDWVTKAGKAKLQEKAQAIVDAVDEALWKDNPRFNAEYRAASAALMEAINQTQNGQGMISAAELHLIAMEMKKTMTDLSPAAQAVLWAFNSKFDWIEDGIPGPQFNAIAAVIRAVADQVVPSDAVEPRNYLPMAIECQRIRKELLTIADELEIND